MGETEHDPDPPIGQDIRFGERKTLTGRLIAFFYGLAAYATFFVSILYAIGFVSELAYLSPSTTARSLPCRKRFCSTCS
jgi:hypothetical protein